MKKRKCKLIKLIYYLIVFKSKDEKKIIQILNLEKEKILRT